MQVIEIMKGEVSLASRRLSTRCALSICSKTGGLLAFVLAAQFELMGGLDALADYQFGKRKIHHLFCKQCGIRSFARSRGPDGGEMVAVNVRCLDGVEVGALTLQPFDGRSVPLG